MEYQIINAKSMFIFSKDDFINFKIKTPTNFQFQGIAIQSLNRETSLRLKKITFNTISLSGIWISQISQNSQGSEQARVKKIGVGYSPPNTGKASTKGKVVPALNVSSAKKSNRSSPSSDSKSKLAWKKIISNKKQSSSKKISYGNRSNAEND